MTRGYYEYLCDDFDPNEFDEDETPRCKECFEEIDEYDEKYYLGYHEDCFLETELFKKSLTMENAIDDDNTATVEIPDFLYNVFGSKVRDILLEKFSQFDEETRERYIADYAKEDLTEWIERNIKNV